MKREELSDLNNNLICTDKKVNLKIVFCDKEDLRCGIAINDKIIIIDTDFEEHLACSEMNLDYFKELSILDKFKDLLATLIDCYYHNSDLDVLKVYDYGYSQKLADYTIIDSEDIEKATLVEAVKQYTSCDNFQKEHEDEIIEKFKINLKIKLDKARAVLV